MGTTRRRNNGGAAINCASAMPGGNAATLPLRAQGPLPQWVSGRGTKIVWVSPGQMHSNMRLRRFRNPQGSRN